MENQPVITIRKPKTKKKSQALKNSAMIVLAGLLGAYSSRVLDIFEKKFAYPISWAALFACSMFMIFIVYFIWHDFVD